MQLVAACPPAVLAFATAVLAAPTPSAPVAPAGTPPPAVAGVVRPGPLVSGADHHALVAPTAISAGEAGKLSAQTYVDVALAGPVNNGPELATLPQSVSATPADDHLCRDNEAIPEHASRLYENAWDLFYKYIETVRWAMETAVDAFIYYDQLATRRTTARTKSTSVGGHLFAGLFDVALDYFLPGSSKGMPVMSLGRREAPAYDDYGHNDYDVDAPPLRAPDPAVRGQVIDAIRKSAASVVPPGYEGHVPPVLDLRAARQFRGPDIAFLRIVASDVPAFLLHLLTEENRCGWALRWQDQLVRVQDLVGTFLDATLRGRDLPDAHRSLLPVFKPLVDHLRELGNFELGERLRVSNPVA